MLCDSNILIYAADPDDKYCGLIVERDDAAIASVSRIEVLGFPGFSDLPEDHRQRLQEIVTTMVQLDLNERVIERAILLRQKRRMPLADAIIAATALVYGQPLATRNTDDFKHIAGLRLVDPFQSH